jgi:predicted nuclease of restriction endonuclease-like (RecB) superfamily
MASLTKREFKRIDGLYEKIVNHIRVARNNIIRAINNEQVKVYWLIGKDIVEEEQAGYERAKYGKAVMKQLSVKLNKDFGKGFGIDTLEQVRKFYLVYKIEKSDALRRKSESDIKENYTHDQLKSPKFKDNLGWTHYRSLMRICNPKARSFYEIEASKNNWSTRELDRQISSLLFERLAKNKDKDRLMELAYRGQEILTPEDAIKEPLVFEFLGWPETHKLVESELEEALINKLEKFLLELGSGFSFVARQKRLTLDNDHFWVDLVMYHTILKCYCLIDLKTHALTHADLGQMQLYRNYYDMECRNGGDNPTIGLILCTMKNEKMVQYFLGDSKNIFASKYQLVLPTEQELEAELKKEIKTIKHELFIAKNSKGKIYE